MFLESYFRQLQVTFICEAICFYQSTNEATYGKNGKERCGIEPIRLSFIHRQKLNREFVNNQRECSLLSFHFNINSKKILFQVRSSTNCLLNNLK